MQHVWLAIILAVGPADASAQAQPVGAIAALVGQGTVIHAAAVGRAPAKIRDEIFVRDRIETAEQSVIRVLMGGRITVTIRERSIVTITDDPTRPHRARLGAATRRAHRPDPPRDPRAPDTRRRPRRGPRPATRWRPGARVPTRGANRTARATGAGPPAAARGRRGAGRAGGARVR